ncbi:MAG: hypothetical protein LBU16_02820 [Treponema sp.]|jgi:hypothetical protein|nr:hypothetical protein [Treponema sp.]
MKRKCGVFFGYAVVLTAAIIIVAGCENSANSDTGGNTGRYETVPVSGANRAANGGSQAYRLASSGYKGDSYYYLYYLGYVKQVPIVHKEQWQYNGTTPITFTYEKNWVNEESITKSTTETVEKASKFHLDGSVTVGVEAEAGAIFAKAKTTLSATLSWGGEWSKSISTADTLETAKTKTEGESEGISVTIGDHGEEVGTYRYALFGVTDFYVLYKVNKDTRAVEEETLITCARASTYAWGIDFDSSLDEPEFGKTGGGDPFEIPAIDFTALEAPTEALEEETVNTPYINTTMPLSVSAQGASLISGTFLNAADPNGVNTGWKFEVKSMTLTNERTIAGERSYGGLDIVLSYTVTGYNNHSVMRIDKTHTVDLSDRRVTQVIGEPQTITGTITGKMVVGGSFIVSSGSISGANLFDWITLPTGNNDLVTSLKSKFDAVLLGSVIPAGISFEAQLDLHFVELNS